MKGQVFFKIAALLSLLGLSVVMSGYHLSGMVMLILFSTVALFMLTLARKTKGIGWTVFVIICTFAAALFGFQEIYESKGVIVADNEWSHESCQNKKTLAAGKKCRATLRVYARHLSFATATTVGFGNVSPTDESMDWANAQMLHGIFSFSLFTGTIIALLLRNTGTQARHEEGEGVEL